MRSSHGPINPSFVLWEKLHVALPATTLELTGGAIPLKSTAQLSNLEPA